MTDQHDNDSDVPEYSSPPEGPEDITPADEVFHEGDEVVIQHGPGDETRLPKDEFYGEAEPANEQSLTFLKLLGDVPEDNSDESYDEQVRALANDISHLADEEYPNLAVTEVIPVLNEERHELLVNRQPTQSAVPEYLQAIVDEALELLENEDMAPSEVAHEVAHSNTHLASPIGDNHDPLEVLAALRDVHGVCADELETYQGFASSYDHGEATVEALVLRTLEDFIMDSLTESEDLSGVVA
jgi:hypothetical protein